MKSASLPLLAAMKRREFITLGGAAIAWPLAARAQQPAKVPTIGVLGSDAAAWRPWTAALVERLHELGWIEGRTIAIEYRWSQARPERAAEIAAVVAAVKQATAVIPIVFALANDPVGGRMVESLARPGGNVTGLSTQGTDLASKRLELLREVLPRLRRLAVIANAGYRDGVLEMREAQTAARTLGLEVAPLEIRRAEDIAPAFAALKAQTDALYVVGDALVNANRTHIITLARDARLATIFDNRNFAEAGGLVSYGPNFPDLFRRTAEFVDKILRGKKPGDIPVEQPTKFDLVVNQTTAKVLGLTLPESFLLRADEVIE